MARYGTKILYDGAGRFESEKLARAFDAVMQTEGRQMHRVGTRDLWEYPEEGIGEGPVVQVDRFQLNYVSVYFDGKGVWLYLAGPSVPNRQMDIPELMTALGGLRLSCQHFDMTSGTEI